VRVSATILACLLWTVPALAQRLSGPGHGPIRAQVTHGRPTMPAHPIVWPPSVRHWHHGHAQAGRHHHHGHHRGFGRHGFVGGGGVVLYSPPLYSAPVYGPPAYSYEPAYAPAPAYEYAPSLAMTPPPLPTVIEHATGRYELRGDGLTSPYKWVWVPYPPAAPPATPPPDVTEPAPSRSVVSAPNEPAPRRSTLYRWKDHDGVMHWTDNVANVPPEFRAKAEVRSF
jgi:hypothetical protein